MPSPRSQNRNVELLSVCEEASVREGAGSVFSAAPGLGVAMVSELQQHASEIATRAALKPPEHKRFPAALAPPQARDLGGDDDAAAWMRSVNLRPTGYLSGDAGFVRLRALADTRAFV